MWGVGSYSTVADALSAGSRMMLTGLLQTAGFQNFHIYFSLSP